MQHFVGQHFFSESILFCFNIDPIELDSVLTHTHTVLTFVDENFHSLGYTCKKLSIYVTFVLFKIGFHALDILLLDNSIDKDKYISYYDMKSLGYSYDQIHAMFYLVNYKNMYLTFFKKGKNRIASEANSHHDCSICIDSFCADTAKVVHLPCGHFYHEKCILEWFKTKFTCPFCRYSLYPNIIQEWIEKDPDSIIYLEIVQQQCNGNVYFIK